MVSARSWKAVLTLAAVVLLGAAPRAHATFPGGNGILGWSEGAGINGLDPGSSTPHLIVDVPGGIDRGLAWSPDGQRIAFAHNDQSVGGAGLHPSIWVANADGTGATQITSGPSDSAPSWSPDGQKIIFSRSGGLCVVDPDGSNLTPLPAAGQEPSWSPDGTKIAFETNNNQEIWLMNPDGSGQAFLGEGTEPDWSPNGEELAVGSESASSDLGLHRLFLDGTRTPSLTPSKPSAFQPGFSPDGTQIAFSAFGTTQNVFTTGYAGGAILTPPGGTNRNNPAWQPLTPVPPAEPYVRPKGATPMYASLVPAYQACNSPDRQHGPPLAFGSCNPPQPTSSLLTVGTPDSNGQRANSVGFIRYDVAAGDVRVTASITDVRQQGSLADYTGELGAEQIVQITDRLNGASQNESGTTQASPFRYAVPCAATGDTSVGASCSLSSTFNAVVPGSVVDGKRAIWELGKVEVYDAGADGQAATTNDNTLFERQGIFIP